MPATAEWTRFTKYARRMRGLKMDLSQEPIPSDVLSVLQLRALNEPLFPNLKLLELDEVTSDIIPLVPLFLHHGMGKVEIKFKETPPAVMVAAMMVNLPKLCPHLQSVSLNPLPRDPTVIDAASEMILTCNLDALQYFLVDSPLTEKANQVIFQLPNLRMLWSVLTQSATLPDVSLPDLTAIDIEFHHDHGWLRAFRKATLTKLTEVNFRAECNQVGSFLEAFEDVALATSASTAISIFRFYTSCSWNPNYHSLLTFKQLKELVLEFSCDNGCSSRIDDEILIALTQAMPMLEILQIGGQPCHVPGGITTRGLIALAHHCPRLSKLRVHFQTNSLVLALAEETPQSSQEACFPRGDSALTTLEVGEIYIPQPHVFHVFLMLVRIFPRLRDIEYVDEGWKWVADSFTLAQRIDSLIHRSGKAPHLAFCYPH